jgi:hypothetical protein
MLGTKVQDELKSRLEDLPPNTIPSNKVTLALIGVTPGTPEFERITEFANGYNGEDKRVTDFCNSFKNAKPNVKSQIVFYSLSKHHSSAQSKVLDAISKGL